MLYPVQTPNQLSTHLRALRLAKKWTQAQLAAKLGLSQTRIARIEKDPLSISVDQLLRVLSALDSSAALQTPDPTTNITATHPTRTPGVAEPSPTDNW